VIDHCFADEDRTLKRFKPRARGRASAIHKRMCHVTIVLRHVAVPEQRDISAAQATIAAESRRARTRRVPGAAATPPAEVEETTAGGTGAEATAETTAAPKAPRKPRAPKAAAEAGESEAGAEAKPARKPRAPKASAETAESETAEPKAAAPRTPRKKPDAKPAEPASPPADDADETAANEGDS
jgi:hypothetical protein